MTQLVIGVDPGGRQTGLVARYGDDLLAADLCTRDGAELFPGAGYLAEVCDAVGGLVVYGQAETGESSFVVAVEGVVHPSGHVRMINAAGLLGTAAVLGAVLVEYPRTSVVVPPAKHGGGPRQAYPPQLWPTTDRKGTGRMRHVRSAWDVADTGALLARLEAGV